MRYKELILIQAIFIVFFISNISTLAQDEEDLTAFIKDYQELILERAHSTSTFYSSEIIIEDENLEDADYRVILTINYKGLIKTHKLVCYLYFKDYPTKFVWGNDTNAFDINTKEDAMIEELKKLWNDWEEENL